MRILVTNDDGYCAKGLQALIRILRPYGGLVIVAPKTAQSGMSMAVSMGHRPIAVKKLSETPGEQWWWLDGTPASCVKFGIDNIMPGEKPDIVVCGINHGSNAATATLYSGTVGAAMEGAINGIPSIALSLDSFDTDADFSAMEELLPRILDKLLPNMSREFGSYYNINFPNLPASEIKGVRICNMGYVHWEKEYRDYTDYMNSRSLPVPEKDAAYVKEAALCDGCYVMVGDMVVNEGNDPACDQLQLSQGYITITPQKLDTTDYKELQRLCDII